MTNMIDQVKPSWYFRRIYIAVLLIFLSLCIAASLGGALWLGYFAKFSMWIASFLIVFVICNFMALLGIIGSYIFGSRWETKDFLDVLPNIIPNMDNDRHEHYRGGRDRFDAAPEDDSGLSVQDMIKGSKE